MSAIPGKKTIPSIQDYEDMLYLPHHVSAVHPQMSNADRAAQFSPFAALTGYDAAIREAARRTERRRELDSDETEELDRRFRLLMEAVRECAGSAGSTGSVDSESAVSQTTADRKKPQVAITFFVPDPEKEGGSYVSQTGTVRKIKEYERLLVLDDGQNIPFDDMIELESDLFDRTEG